MSIPLADRHVVELILLNAFVLLPIVYAAFSFASYAFIARAAGRTLRDRRVALATFASGLLYGSTVLVTWKIVNPTVGLPHMVATDPVQVFAPMVSAMVVACIANVRLRSLVLASSMMVYVVAIEGVLWDPEFLAMDMRDTTMVILALLVMVAMSVAAAYNMATPSLVGRAAAVASSVWSMALVTVVVKAVGPDGERVLAPSTGVMTPNIVEAMTVVVLVCGALTAADTRRLARRQNREKRLSKSEARMRMLADATREGLIVHRGGVVLDTNRTFRELVGEPLEIDTFADRELGYYLGERALPADGGETWLRHRQGTMVCVEVHEAPLDDGRSVISVRDLTRAKRDENRIRELAQNDALTGLANRGTFDAAMRESRPVSAQDDTLWAVLMIDLDRFKPVNDTYGHAAGDQLLKALARRFEAVLRRTDSERADDLLARIGGDEFAVLVRVSDVEAARRLGQRLCAVAGQPVLMEHADDSTRKPHGEVLLKAGASVGVAICDSVAKGRDVCEPEDLRQRSDLALYAAKDEGRGCVVVYDDAMGARASRKLSVEGDLRTALERGEISLHYQMQQDLKSGEVVGYEALMRWNHPEHGQIGPDEFIPLAEDTGLIVPLGAWALERAACDFAELDDRTRVSVNVSPRQFVSGDLVEDVARALSVSGLAAERLELEITETVMIEDAEGTLAVLDRLRAMGVSLSLDDFGSGYSSLSYLTRFPFSKLKIDRQFITRMGADPRSLALVRSILAMAGSLDMRVTAEGVETNAQLMALVTGHCDEAQGFLLGRPCDFETVRRRFAQTREMRAELA